jgi:hypothetical protein
MTELLIAEYPIASTWVKQIAAMDAWDMEIV